MKLVQYILSKFPSATANSTPANSTPANSVPANSAGAESGSVAESPPVHEGPIPASWEGPSPKPRGLPTIRPEDITHIVLMADPSESLTDVDDLEPKIMNVWKFANRDMFRALEGAELAPSIHYVEVSRYMEGIPGVDSDHFVGEHLYDLGVAEQHSVVVQMLEVRIGGEVRDITLETVHRTENPRCVISKSPLRPAACGRNSD